MSVARSSDVPLLVQGRSTGLREVFKRRDLLNLLVHKELRVRYRASLLGLGWSYVKPAVQFGTYFIGLGILLRQNVIPNYAVYMFGGLVVMNFFGEALGNATRSIVANADLVRKIYLPRELFPVASVLVAGVHLLPQLLVLLAGAVMVGWRPDIKELVALSLAILLVALLSLGLGLLLAAANVFFRDLENVVDLILTVTVWGSPVLYPTRVVSDLLGADSIWFAIYQLNPLTVAVDLIHRAAWVTTAPGGWELLSGDLGQRTVIAFGLALACIAIGQFVFTRLSGRMAQEL